MARGMIFKVTSHNGAENLGLHFKKTEDNEVIESDVDVHDFVLVCEELKAQALAASSRGKNCKRGLIHVSVAPERDLTKSEWEVVWKAYEKEFGLIGQPFLDVKHIKTRVDGSHIKHCHRVYPGVNLATGKGINQQNNFPRQEKLARLLEVELGMQHVKGRFNKAVEQKLRGDGLNDAALSMVAAGLLVGRPGIASKKQWESEQQKRTGSDMEEARDKIAVAFLSSENQPEFVGKLEIDGFGLYQGDKVPIVVGLAGDTYPLLRAITQSRTVKEQKLTIKKADVNKVINFTTLPLLAPTVQAKASQRKTQYQKKTALKKIARKEIIIKPGSNHITGNVNLVASEYVSMQERYGDYLAKLLEEGRFIQTDMGMSIYSFGANVVDVGSQIMIDEPSHNNVGLMLDLAAAKGWTQLSMSGSTEFKQLAAIEAIRRGFDLQDAELKQYAITYLKKEADRQSSQLEFTRALCTHGPEALNSSVSFKQLIKMVSQVIQLNNDAMQRFDKEIAELTSELSTIPETTNDIWFLKVPELKVAFEQRAYALVRMKTAEMAHVEAKAHRVLGVFKTRSEKNAYAELDVTKTNSTALDRTFKKLRKSVDTPQMHNEIATLVARRKFIKDRLASLNDNLSAHSLLAPDWELLEVDLRKYSEIMGDTRFVVKTSILALRNDILLTATEKLRQPRALQDTVVEDKKKLEMTLKEEANGPELLNTETQHPMDNVDGHNQEVLAMDFPSP